jgi:Ammonium Transporter Family
VYYAGIRTGGHQLAVQIVGICFAIGWSFAGTYIILQIIDICIGLRVSSIDEELGLDSSIHGEQVGTQMKLKSDYVNGNDDVNIGVVGGISTVVWKIAVIGWLSEDWCQYLSWWVHIQWVICVD